MQNRTSEQSAECSKHVEYSAFVFSLIILYWGFVWVWITNLLFRCGRQRSRQFVCERGREGEYICLCVETCASFTEDYDKDEEDDGGTKDYVAIFTNKNGILCWARKSEQHRVTDMASISSSSSSSVSAAALNISCTCTECTTFLRPIIPSTSHHPRNSLECVFPIALISTHASTPVWVDKLSLAAYDVQIGIPAPAPAPAPRVHHSTHGQQQLSVITSTTSTTASTHSAFPKTPGTLRCANTHCRTRIPVASAWATAAGLRDWLLCEEHGEQFFDVEEHLVQTERDITSPGSAVVWDIIDSYQRSSAESCWGSIDMSGERRPGLISRTSSSVSWRSLASSWEGDDAELEWDGRAFDSKLCW